MNFLICDAIFLSNRVVIGSYEHLIPIFLAFLFGTSLIAFSVKCLSLKKQFFVFKLLSLLVSGVVFMYHLYHLHLGTYDLTTDLPLYLCSLVALIIPVFGFYRKYWMFEILFFWIVAGTSQGVLTPDIPAGFPAFDYFRYWVVHLGLLIIICYATFVFKMKPNFKSVFKSFLALQVYILLMMIVNHLLGANYFYLNKKPESASLLDYFGEWPYYIISTQLLIIPVFLLIYSPFYFKERKKG